jgi:hypothetical protein
VRGAAASVVTSRQGLGIGRADLFGETAPFRICSFFFDPSALAFSQLFCGHFVATRTDFFEFSGAEPLALNFEMPV